MPLNYSKWDQLELSDDSDIEGHPNVDKKSLIRWKQRDIHEKREQRKQKIAHLRAQIDCNKVLYPRIQDIYTHLSSPSDTSPTVYFNSLYEQLQKNPSKDCPPGNDPNKLEHTYDGMLLSLLGQVSAEAKDKIKDTSVLESEKDEKLGKALTEKIKFHVDHLGETIKKDEAELAAEEKEQKKHITSDDLHDGFSSKYIPPKPDPTPVPLKKIEKPKTSTTTTEFETLNPQASSSTLPPSSATTDEDDALPELTPSLSEFSKIPYREFQKSFEFIQLHRDVFVPGASDALLVAAFTAEGEGKKKLAKQCVHQSLLLQYCEKLGGDGVRVFFQKMISGDKRAEKVFLDDVESTYNHLRGRVEASKLEESAEGKEQIQLVPESPDQTISFNVPSGPPPETIVLEGPGTEDMDIEEVRKALQFRWDVFCTFPENLQKALEENSLENVNKVLADMDVAEAEGVVQNLDIAGILSFAEGGIRDETGKA
ncbi:Cdc37 N terminal kinase binding-domain-containing protein [Lentinula raphanica]|uniref:Hsp90 chaperone protein kinase-targeting subunit n=1 Tax=Lentinula raphanica TaxID=153919 RepID=A0AA38PA35_9AGAR|nr:Cdc37 N terminal kinase binding-domain-containing protein [Lentinula raphanica]KAJ3972973.1 Cdc37 N terminal kinase binding-domain-containing protein [Lentinula raphanica]